MFQGDIRYITEIILNRSTRYNFAITPRIHDDQVISFKPSHGRPNIPSGPGYTISVQEKVGGGGDIAGLAGGG